MARKLCKQYLTHADDMRWGETGEESEPDGLLTSPLHPQPEMHTAVARFHLAGVFEGVGQVEAA